MVKRIAKKGRTLVMNFWVVVVFQGADTLLDPRQVKIY